MSVTTTVGVDRLGGGYQFVVVGRHRHQLQVGLESEEGPHTFPDEHAVIGQHDRGGPGGGS
jgi:hypothetical protein